MPPVYRTARIPAKVAAEDPVLAGFYASPPFFRLRVYDKVNRRLDAALDPGPVELDNRNRSQFSARVLALALIFGGWSTAAAGADGARLPPTEETDIGIYYVPDAPETRNLWRQGDPGERLLLRGRVLDTGGAPVAGAQVELWHADGNGQVHPDRYRTRLRTGPAGEFGVTTALPGYIPDAPGVWGARHIHVVVTHPDYRRLISLILFEGDPNLAGLDYSELAVFVEQARIRQQAVQFAEAILVLQQ